MKPAGNTSGSATTAQLRRVHTPTVIQMEAVECGAASLAIVLGYYKVYVPLEELRVACGVSRDGSKASNIVKAAKNYKLIARGLRKEPNDLKNLPLPMIVYWNFNHFLVVEGFGKDKVYLNDPASGPRTVTESEFSDSFTGVVLTFEKAEDFAPSGKPQALLPALRKRLVGLEPAIGYIVLTGLALLLTGFVIPVFSRVFIDDILLAHQNWIQALLVGMALTALLRAAWTWLQSYFLLRLETFLAISTSSKFFQHILNLPTEFFAQRYAGDISSRIAINDQVATLLSEQLATTLLNIVLVVFYVILMLQYDPLLTFIGVAIALSNIFALRLVSRRRVDANQKLLQERAKLIGTIFNGLQIIETLKATGTESDFFARWAGYQAKAVTAEQELGTLTQILAVVPTLLTAVNTAAILFIGGLRVMDGALTIGMLVAFQSLMASFIDPVNEIVALGGTLQEVQGNLNRLDDVFNYEQDRGIAQSAKVLAPKGAPAKLAGYLELRNVTFGYSRLDKPLIEDFSLWLKPGDRVALVGASGSGKSTIAKLVSGLWEPWSGDVLFDGVERKSVPRRVLTNSLAMVDQDIALFEGTIRENLTLWDHTIPDVDVVQAAKDGVIHNEIANREGGYEHLVEEGGRNFSGGQRQRLEIARALINNPSILVLDEATSALDPVTEKVIDDNLRRRGCTCLIIAHRLSTIRDCDEIIVLEKGKVVQRGTHDELYKVDGPYANLIRAEEKVVIVAAPSSGPIIPNEPTMPLRLPSGG
jgi:NHLM bacteriocin system ABC transporter peptidase/ATP-binding protein